LAAARRLRRLAPALEVALFERQPEPGGRAASRQRQGATFDHGAQFIRTPTPALGRLLRACLPHDTLHDIQPPVWVFDGAGQIEAGDPAQNADPKWTYGDGLSRLGRELAAGLTIHYEQPAARLTVDGRQFTLHRSDDSTLAQADAVLLTPPAPETAELVSRSRLDPAVSQAARTELAQAPYRRCLSVTLGFRRPLAQRPWYALVNGDKRHPISWLAYEHLKDGRDQDGQAVVICQMAPGWSETRWDQADPLVAAAVADLASMLLAEDLRRPDWSDCARWPHALPDGQADFERLNALQPGLFFAGDYTAGLGRVHLAVEQGWRAAELIASFAAQATGGG
jgi:predicted NAD/FAD-dependent oxidoreductase